MIEQITLRRAMTSRLKILFVLGTRPEAIKLAPVIQECRRYRDLVRSLVCSTGQHIQLFDQALDLFEIRPDFNLALMQENQFPLSFAVSALQALDPVITQTDPDWVLVQGDTITALAGATAAFLREKKVAHVEAGLRTRDLQQPFPEEGIRRMIASVAALHFAPTVTAYENLVREGIPGDRIVLSGNPGVDALGSAVELVEQRIQRPPIQLKDGTRLLLVTVHRRESFGAPLRRICASLLNLAKRYSDTLKIIVPVHPNPTVASTLRHYLEGNPIIDLLPPLGYAEFVWLLKRAYLVLTDSGGIQEEAPCLGKPVVVLRAKTERSEGVAAGVAVLVGTDTQLIEATVARLLDDPETYERFSRQASLYGDGKAAQRIVAALLERSNTIGLPDARIGSRARTQAAYFKPV